MTQLSSFKMHALIVAVSAAAYFPFVNQAFTMDSDMLVHGARQMNLNPADPPLGAYGRNMVWHDKTTMPAASFYRRCAHPPLLPLLLSPVARVAGTREWPFHAAMYLFYLAAIYGGWYLFGLLFSRPLQVYGTLVWALCPALVVISHTIMWDVPITALMLWTLALFLDAIRRKHGGVIVACGIVTGLAAVTKANCLPLYFVIGGYLLVTRRFRFFFLWLPGALVFPAAWIVHNMIVFGKIQYISTGLFHPTLGDVRYRFERYVSYAGGVVLFPLWWLWLFAVKPGRFRSIAAAVAGFTSVWSGILYAAVKQPLWFCLTYWIFSTAGCLAMVRMVTWWRQAGASAEARDRAVVSLYALLYAVLMHTFPSASVRYMLPLLPCAVIVMLACMESLKARLSGWFGLTNIAAIALLSTGLSVCYYLLGDADRRLPGELTCRGWSAAHSWYFGRLSFDYYLFQAGFQSTRTSASPAQDGDRAVDESIPADYPLSEGIPDELRLEAVDTLRYFSFPLRTHGMGAGFDGESRLPYTLNWHAPVRQYILCRLRRRDAALR
jgi:hypothetical protein